MTGTRGAAVVTGGAGGLGQAFVTALTAAGYAVVPVDLHGTERLVDVTDADAHAGRSPTTFARRSGQTTPA